MQKDGHLELRGDNSDRIYHLKGLVHWPPPAPKSLVPARPPPRPLPRPRPRPRPFTSVTFVEDVASEWLPPARNSSLYKRVCFATLAFSFNLPDSQALNVAVTASPPCPTGSSSTNSKPEKSGLRGERAVAVSNWTMRLHKISMDKALVTSSWSVSIAALSMLHKMRWSWQIMLCWFTPLALLHVRW